MARMIRVTGAWTQLLVDWLDHERLGAPDIRAMLARWAPEDAVPITVWRDLLAQAVALRLQLQAPGLAIGSMVQPHHVGVMGYVVLASRNLGEAMQTYQRYERLFYGADLVTVVAIGHEVEVRWPREMPSFNQLTDAVGISALITFLRQQLDDPPAISLVSFVNPAPDAGEQAIYEAFFGCPVHFDDSYTRVRFSASYLLLPMARRDASLRTLLDRHLQALLLALPDPDAFDRALQQVMLKLLPEGTVSLPRTARALCISVRTLQRRLDANGICWQLLLDRTREQLARQYLADRSLTLGDIALLLGFSEQSAFNRAFKRWTGLTPMELRRQQN